MKKIVLLYFTVAKNCVSTASCTFFHQLLEIDTWNTYGILFSVEQMTFFFPAVKIPKKSVEQSRFEQMHFEQLTLTLTLFCTKTIRSSKIIQNSNLVFRRLAFLVINFTILWLVDCITHRDGTHEGIFSFILFYLHTILKQSDPFHHFNKKKKLNSFICFLIRIKTGKILQSTNEGVFVGFLMQTNII